MQDAEGDGQATPVIHELMEQSICARFHIRHWNPPGIGLTELPLVPFPESQNTSNWEEHVARDEDHRYSGTRQKLR
jgi:hypothetical protein